MNKAIVAGGCAGGAGEFFKQQRRRQVASVIDIGFAPPFGGVNEAFFDSLHCGIPTLLVMTYARSRVSFQ
jgi:hypothetical protein